MADTELMLDVGQANEIKLAARRAGATNADLKSLSEGDTFGKVLPILRGLAEAVLINVLDSYDPITVTLSDRHDPDAFYHTRPDLDVSDDFRERVVKAAKTTDAGASFTLNCAKLMSALTTAGIEYSLPKEHYFDETTLCAVIAALIANQPNGKEGALCNLDGYNIFYTRPCVVRVYWNSYLRKWRVLTIRRDISKYFPGALVFSPLPVQTDETARSDS